MTDCIQALPLEQNLHLFFERLEPFSDVLPNCDASREIVDKILKNCPKIYDVCKEVCSVAIGCLEKFESVIRNKEVHPWVEEYFPSALRSFLNGPVMASMTVALAAISVLDTAFFFFKMLSKKSISEELAQPIITLHLELSRKIKDSTITDEEKKLYRSNLESVARIKKLLGESDSNTWIRGFAAGIKFIWAAGLLATSVLGGPMLTKAAFWTLFTSGTVIGASFALDAFITFGLKPEVARVQNFIEMISMQAKLVL